MSGPPTNAVMIALMSMIAAGCATTVTPPPAGEDLTPVYLTDYGRHSSLLLPGEHGKLVEFAFGDFDWFALGKNSPSDGLRALLFSAGSTLGKRTLDVDHDLTAIEKATTARRIMTFRVPRQRVDALLNRLSEAFDARMETLTYNPESAMWFVRSDEHYWLLHNCNHVTARWLRALGCEVHGPSIYSNFTLHAAAAAVTVPTTAPATSTTRLPRSTADKTPLPHLHIFAGAGAES